MIYVIMRRDREWQLIEAIAAFDSHFDACKYADELEELNKKYAYRIDSVYLNPENIDK